ncbi:spore maturation protein [Sporanaerobacter acetigenes]|uniref:Spore maturation protein B n=1 Tax=Sporanaerobacter acetigenes DSM 13106 TaxID=1123281 RepID=A0A1M5VNQ0_9FIRM|nr:nucleoside recognition domain-containing protein [Sporanaerobacter acetigenes]SHH76543.1 spore maturation protein B [Sporanaerobacter acetigenes DSM 13106]
MKAISIGLVPFITLTIIIYGYVKGIDIYSAFIEGVKEGIKTSIKIMPYLIAIFVSIGIFRGSHALYMLMDILSPIMEFVGIPVEVLPLVIMRPISGSGALGVVKDIIENYGPDSFPGQVASIMMGSSETIFYTMAVYFGSIGIRDHRYTLKAALISYIASIFASVFVCNIFL